MHFYIIQGLVGEEMNIVSPNCHVRRLPLIGLDPYALRESLPRLLRRVKVPAVGCGHTMFGASVEILALLLFFEQRESFVDHVGGLTIITVGLDSLEALFELGAEGQSRGWSILLVLTSEICRGPPDYQIASQLLQGSSLGPQSSICPKSVT